MQPEASSPNDSKRQYHHFIPRFILRNFQLGEKQNKKQRQRNFRINKDTERVFFYDIAAGTLEIRPVGDVYGVVDLYRDEKQLQNAYDVEKKLSKLESLAARVIKGVVDTVAIGKGSYLVKRSSLNDLRKFLYIMYFRNNGLAGTYFQADHPDNVGARSWIQKFGKKVGSDSAIDMWLYTLRYYLDTTHVDLMWQAFEIKEKYGEDLIQMVKTGADSDIEQFNSLAYEGQANGFFLCIWQAADDEEFILSQNCFGLWEGRLFGQPGLHNIFVVSPRVAFVLSSGVFRDERAPKFLNPGRSSDSGTKWMSSFLDIPHESPIPCYNRDEFNGRFNPEMPTQRAYLSATLPFLDDQFEFKIVKLSQSQTRRVNVVLMDNIRDNGAVTFLSWDPMLRLVRSYCDNILNQNGSKFYSLLSELSAVEPFEESKDDIHVSDDLKILLKDIVLNRVHFRSNYDKAFAIFHAANDSTGHTDPFSSEYQRLVATLVYEFSQHLIEPPSGDTVTQPDAELVSSLSQLESNRIFSVMHTFASKLELPKSIASALLLSHQIMEEAVIVGLLDWVVKSRPDVLDFITTRVRVSLRQKDELEV